MKERKMKKKWGENGEKEDNGRVKGCEKKNGTKRKEKKV